MDEALEVHAEMKRRRAEMVAAAPPPAPKKPPRPVAVTGGVDKTRVSEELDNLRTTFGRSLVATRDLAAGAQLTEADVAAKKPGGGLPPKALDQVVGRRLLVAVERDQPLHQEMLEPAMELQG